MTRTPILVIGLPEIDPKAWFSFGAVGLRLIVMNVLAVRQGGLPASHALSGILLGIGHRATVFTAPIALGPLCLVAWALGALPCPFRHVWLRMKLFRAARQGDCV
jgi:hypothetical protein